MKKLFIMFLALGMCGATVNLSAQNPGPSSVSALEVTTNRVQFDQVPVVLCGWLVKLDKKDSYGLFPSLEEADRRLYASAFLVHLSRRPVSQEVSETFQELNGQYVEIHADFELSFRRSIEHDNPFCGYLVNVQKIGKKQSRIRDEIDLEALKPLDSMPEWVKKKSGNGSLTSFEYALAHPQASHGSRIHIEGYWKQLSEHVFGVFRNRTDAEYENPGNMILVNFKDSGLPISLKKAVSLNGRLVCVRGNFLQESCTLKSCQKEVFIGRIGFVTDIGEPGGVYLLEPSTARNPSVPACKGVLPDSWVHSVEELLATPQYLGSTVTVQGFLNNTGTPALCSRFSTPNSMIFFGNSEFSVSKYQKYHGEAVLLRGKLVMHNGLFRLINEEILDIYPPSSDIVETPSIRHSTPWRGHQMRHLR